MIDKTFFTLFSGGELAGVGARMAGYRHIGGIEKDPKIAAVAALNGFDVTVADILDCDPHDYQTPTLLHASPVCTRASIANAKRGESKLDIAMGDKTAEFIQILLPPLFTLENVEHYKNFQAFKNILRALDDNGYFYHFEVLNAADFGVPQTRRRLFVRAVRGGWVPYLPEPVKWKGWYQAIEDLIPTLPDSQFAPWQLERMPEALKEHTLFSNGGFQGELQSANDERPSHTVTGNINQLHLRAFLIGGANTSQEQAAPGVGVSDDDEPTRALASNGLSWRAFVLDGQGNEGERVTIRDEEDPIFTITASNGRRHARAFLVQGGNKNPNSFSVRDDHETHTTITASMDRTPSRALLNNGRVVKMTPRALARFQTIPDDYILPNNPKLAGQIIGNGVPCLMYQKIVECFSLED